MVCASAGARRFPCVDSSPSAIVTGDLARRSTRIFLLALVALLRVSSTPARAQLVACSGGADEQRVEEALRRIEASLDPCGETRELRSVLEVLRGCPTASYHVCTSREATRNLFDRPPSGVGERPARVITWNPALTSELEDSCDGDPSQPVRRDATASLLHELVHAAHDCLGVDPGNLELEAVRIENIYRRAAGLCQRSSYGDEPLPARLRKTCNAEHCPCSSPIEPGEVAHLENEEGASPELRIRLGDSAESR